MPLYDYRCADCAGAFERRHGWNEPAGTCPRCGSDRLTRLLPMVSVQVKGGTRGSATALATEESCTPQGCARPGCPSAQMN
jgi:putative FmdB family regulatory protein